MIAPETFTWSSERASERAREAYHYVARLLPPTAAVGLLEPIGEADRAVLEAEAARDWPRYEEALRELCRVARREARRAAA
jgi:hypothetical protein